MEKKKKKAATPIRKDTRKKSGKTNLTLANAPERSSKPKPPTPALDEGRDFDKPTRGDGTGTPETAPAEAPAEKGSLLAPQPPAPTVVGKRILMHYLKPTFSKTKKGTRLVAMHLSFALTEKHTADSLLPKGIRESWDVISSKGRKKLDLVGIAGQRAEFYMTQDIDDVKLVLAAAEMSNVSLAVIQKKGDGEAQKIIRLSFRLQVPVTPDVEAFAVMNYGNDFWLTLEETEEDLFEEDED
jgi:hypothetical protein